MTIEAWGFTPMASNPASPEATFNRALDVIGAGAPGAVLASASLTDPPPDPPELALYAVPAAATGAWAGHGGKLARRHLAAWAFFTPPDGARAFILDEGRDAVFIAAHGWLRGAAVGRAGGAAFGFAVAEAVAVDLSGASVTLAGLIPERAVVVAVSTRTSETITGATGYQVGDGVVIDRFGASLGVAAGSNNVGVIGPLAYYAPAPVVLTAQGGAFTGGAVRVAVHYIAATPPAMP